MPVPYATVDDFRDNVDARALAELGSDTDMDGVVSDSNAILVAALTRASNDVKSYVLNGGRYTLSDLDELQTEDDTTFKGLVCDVALGILIARRVSAIPESVKARLAVANQTLIDLRDGKLVFGGVYEERIGPSVPKISVISAQQRGNLGFVSDEPFFPQRRVQAW